MFTQSPLWKALAIKEFGVDEAVYGGLSWRQQCISAYRRYRASKKAWKVNQSLLRDVTAMQELRRKVRFRLDIIQHCIAIPGAQVSALVFAVLISLRATNTVPTLSWQASFAPLWVALIFVKISVLAGEWAAQRRLYYLHPCEVPSEIPSR